MPRDRILDPVGLRDGEPGRDGARTPMPWSDAPGAGFTAPGVEPWLPFGDLGRNVAAQRADRGSILHLVRDLVALRRAEDALRAARTRRWRRRRGRGPTAAARASRSRSTSPTSR